MEKRGKKTPQLESEKPKMESHKTGESFHFTDEHVKAWTRSGLMPKDLTKELLYQVEKSRKQSTLIDEYKKIHPNATTEQILIDVIDPLLKGEKKNTKEELKNAVKLHEFLKKNWEKLNSIQSLQELDPLFKNIDQSTHFGIVRFIADQMSHLPSLLEDSKVEEIGANEYAIKASKELKEEGIKTLEFSYPITAKNYKDAKDLSEKIKEKLMGIRHKMWQSCWLYANEVKKTQFTAPIIELMKSCYPKREAKFSSNDKEGFYEELRLLRLAEFTLIGTLNQNKKPTKYRYHIPFLTVGGAISDHDSTGSTPDKVFIDLCAITPDPDGKNMRYVGAPIRKTTLELSAQDCPLSFFLQLRKNQLDAGKKEKMKPSHDFPVEKLIEVSGLQKTYKSNPRMGIKRLSEKLKRAQQKSIISNFLKTKLRHETVFRIWW